MSDGSRWARTSRRVEPDATVGRRGRRTLRAVPGPDSACHGTQRRTLTRMSGTRVDAFDDSFDAMGQFTDTVAGDLRDPYPGLAEKRRSLRRWRSSTSSTWDGVAADGVQRLHVRDLRAGAARQRHLLVRRDPRAHGGRDGSVRARRHGRARAQAAPRPRERRVPPQGARAMGVRRRRADHARAHRHVHRARLGRARPRVHVPLPRADHRRDPRRPPRGPRTVPRHGGVGGQRRGQPREGDQGVAGPARLPQRDRRAEALEPGRRRHQPARAGGARRRAARRRGDLLVPPPAACRPARRRRTGPRAASCSGC